MLKEYYWKLLAQTKIWLLTSLNKWRLLPYVNFTYRISENGQIIEIPLIAGAGIDNIFLSERWMIELLRKLLPLKDGFFIDIGANIGQTLIKLKRASPNRAYIGFEPNPVCVNYLLELLRRNAFSNTDIIPVGIFDSPALLKLVSYDANDRVPGDATIMGKDFRPTHEVVDSKWVSLLPFDTAIEPIGMDNIGIIKIDVEGAEVQVLNSLKNTINRWRPILLIEILPLPTETETLAKNSELEYFFAALDYVTMRVMKNGPVFAGLVSIVEIGANLAPDGWDYVFLPSELRSKL